jgi:spermidine synthase
MARPWQTIDRAVTPDGVLELRQRGDRDFLILINGRVLMNSSANRSEVALGEQTARAVAARPEPRVLIGGLGMGITLRAALDALPPASRVVVSELNPVIVDWCRGPLGSLTNHAADDPRVSVEIRDVADVIASAAKERSPRFDAIVIDLYEGPGSDTDPVNDPIYGSKALQRTADALTTGGVFAVWGEAPDSTFEKRLAAAHFAVDRKRPGRGGLRHVCYHAIKTAPTNGSRKRRQEKRGAL